MVSLLWFKIKGDPLNFFNDRIAGYVQYVSIIIEALGLILTYLEVMHPNKADSLEHLIDHIENFLKNLLKKDSPALLSKKETKAAYIIGILIGSILILVQFIIAISIQFFFWEIGSMMFEPLNWVNVIILIAFIVISILLSFYLAHVIVLHVFLNVFQLFMQALQKLIVILNHTTKGRALGGIGILLAFGGFIGELYQILTIYYSQ